MRAIETKIKTITFFQMILLTVALLFSTLMSSSLMAKPLGWERIWLSGLKSDVFRDKSTKYVFEHYAKPLLLNGPTGGVTNKRLIDIEAHVIGKKGHQELRLSGIWIENTNYFEQESWLTIDIGFLDLFNMHVAYEMDIIPLDIERYKLNGTHRYAVIWQRNVHKSRWYTKTTGDGVSLENIRNEEANGFRVVDFDHFKVYDKNYDVLVSENFDAIMVENTGGNYLNSELTELLPVDVDCEGSDPPGGDLPQSYYCHYWGFMFPKGSIAVDIENVNFTSPQLWNGLGYAIIVHDANACEFAVSDHTYYDEFFKQNQEYIGRVIDYENPHYQEPYAGMQANSLKVAAIHGCPYVYDGD